MKVFLIGATLLVLFKSSSGQNCKTTSEKGAGKNNTDCAIPWKFNGELINGCTDKTDTNGRFWCSTKVDKKTKEHIGGQGNWGFCRESCTKCPDSKCPKKPPTASPKKVAVAPQTVSCDVNVGIQPPPPPNGITNTSDGRFHPREKDGTCGEYLGTGFIIGGVKTKRGELPYQVILGYRRRRKTKYNCGGVLINRRYVLTAAHCQGKLPFQQIREVVLGEWDLKHDPDCAGHEGGCKPNSPFRKVQRFEVTRNDIKVHECWDPNRVAENGNDIALIRLPRLANTATENSDGLDPFDEIVFPVCLGWDNTITVPKDKFTVSGWGRTSNDPYDRGDTKEAGAHSSILQKLENVPFIDHETCKKNWTIFRGITEKQICAGGITEQDSCSGDSGGPLVSQIKGDFKKPKYLVGIVSFGTKKCGSGYPGIYTSIEYYLPWIIANMKK